MDSQSLKYFTHVADLGSFSRAAESLGVAQPGLSRHIAALEHDLGTKLFVRHHRGVTLTEAGVLLRERAGRILRALEQTREEVAARAKEPSGEVGLGLPVSMLKVLSGPLVERYCRKYPKVTLKVYEGISNELAELLANNEVDVAIIITSREPVRNAELTPLMAETLYLAGPKDAGLKEDETLTFRDLNHRPMVLNSPPNHLRLRLDSLVNKYDIDLNVAVEVQTLPLMIELVRRGLGYSLLPFCAIKESLAAGDISASPMKNMAVTWTLGVTKNRPFSPAVTEMERMIREVIDEQTTSGTWRVIKPGQS